MKKLVLLFLLISISFVHGGIVSVTGKGQTEGQAYLDAMAKAPQGSYWKIVSVNKKGGNGIYFYTIVFQNK